ncbi:MAG: protein-disulfide reductase DsbD family protein [Pseudomonadota bacterium]
MKYNFLILLLLTLCTFTPEAQAQDFRTQGFNTQGYDTQAANQPAEKHVAVTMNADTDAVVPGQTFRIGFMQSIDPDWHTYWINPGDSGAETRIDWTLPDGFTAGDIQWPVPDRIPYESLINFGYSDTAYFLIELTAPENLTASEVTISAEMDWLVCSDICIPEQGSYSLTLPIAGTANPANEFFFTEAEAQQPISVDWPAQYSLDQGEIIFTITPPADQAALLSETALDLFPVEWGLIQNNVAQEVSITDDQLRFRIPAGDRDINEALQTPLTLRAEQADGTVTGYSLDAEYDPAAATGRADGQSGLAVTGGILKHILFALIGGLILNLMPCVFPVLSLKALGLIQTKDKTRAHIAAHGFAYTAGILISFGVFAATILGLRSVGTALGWGFQLQNPYNILLLSYLMFVIGLNLSGLFTLSGKFVNLGSGLTRSTTYSSSFFTGILAALVATPCTAPFMAGAIGYAIVQPTAQAFIVFLSVGLGLALPYLLLTLVPATQKILPRPGAWMEHFRQFLAFPMFLTAAWLLWVLGQQVGNDAVFMALTGMVVIALLFWMLRISGKFFGRVLIVILVLSVLASLVFLPQSAPEEPLETGQAFSTDILEARLQEDTPVFVNMTAAWCITCKVNERVALATDATKQLFDTHNVTMLTGDWTNENPEITAYLKKFGRNGVPLYVYYGQRDPDSGQRPDPIVLPQVLTPNLLKKTVLNNQH